jgi:LysM repeat protein
VSPDRDPGREDDARATLAEWAPRIIAPVVFFLAATILILLVNSAIESGSDAAATTTPTTTQPSVSTEPTGTGDVTTGKPRKFYRVKVGDTLETIANQFDTTVDDLNALNPTLDPNNLQVGQRIRIQ